MRCHGSGSSDTMAFRQRLSLGLFTLLALCVLVASARAQDAAQGEAAENIANVSNEEEAIDMAEEGSIEGEDDDQQEEEEEEDLVTVESAFGVIQGKEVDHDGGVRHYQFLGIPYAEPPVGPLRFKDPVPKRPLSEPLKATKYGASCAQIEFLVFGSVEEDCLFLNVFTPRLPARRGRQPPKSSLLPVMIWVHGGGFYLGSGEIDPSPLLEKGVVVVSINYRLGPLGFFSLGNPSISGNQGLKDQVEAFRWVKQNILAFGGDPQKVTIFGESAGSMSVHFQQVRDG